METGRPVSLLKKGIDDLKQPWPDEPDRFNEAHIDAFLLWCVARDASDITFQTNRRIYAEIYGSLYPATIRAIDGADMAAVITKIYGAEALAILAGGADIDLSYEIMTDRSSRTRFRVNITAILSQGRDGIQVTMRVLPKAPMTMKEYGVEPEIMKYWRPKNGLVLVTGPTGSGKTSLLAAGVRTLLESLHGCGKLLTYEAPIEYTYDTVVTRRSLVAQSEIPRHLPTFAAGVRNALRRKPEIILVGESRDRETIAAAIEAGQTGHLVFSTVHTTGVAQTIRRMVATFEPSERQERAYALMETVRLIVTQTLVAKIGGGRLAMREYMPFTEDVRERLLGLPSDQWTAELTKMLPKYGRTMEQTAKEAYEAGLIEKRIYLQYAQGAAAIEERREMAEKDEAAKKR